jgi:hypothetical protein
LDRRRRGIPLSAWGRSGRAGRRYPRWPIRPHAAGGTKGHQEGMRGPTGEIPSNVCMLTRAR